MTENLLFTFASNEVNPISRAFIRLTELSTGQPKLKKIYDQYIEDDRPPELFWHDAIKRLNLKIKIKSNDLDTIPKKGRLLVFPSKKILHGVSPVHGDRYTHIAWWQEK